VVLFRDDEIITLRPIEIRRIDHQGPAFLLRDPLQLSDEYVIVPHELAPLLSLFDGAYSYGELRRQIGEQIGAQSGPALLDQILEALDQALLFENATFRTALDAARTGYRSAPFREPTLAGRGYPDDPGQLRVFFDELLAASESEPSPPACRAIFSPHIDYPRGGSIYANVWKSSSAAVCDAELILLLATDHYSPEPLTLTRQRYATPYGALPTDDSVVDQLADTIGERAFDAELFHRSEHSVELVVNWVHHLREQPCPVIPLLCGSFQRFTREVEDPADDPQLTALIQTIQDIASRRRTLIVISGDLSHVGPAFGGRPLDEQAEQQLRHDDEQLLAQLGKGSADGFFRSIAALRDRNNVCGLPPGYLALRALGPTRGELFGYQRCPADGNNTSAVTIAGMVFQ
jgi:AmmeMemoRadiSam system protein B